MIRVGVDIRHATAQARLQLGGVVLEELHDGGPRHAGEDGPGVVANGVTPHRFRHAGEADPGLDRQPRECEHHAREHVDHDLLVDARDLARL